MAYLTIKKLKPLQYAKLLKLGIQNRISNILLVIIIFYFILKAIKWYLLRLINYQIVSFWNNMFWRYQSICTNIIVRMPQNIWIHKNRKKG